MVSEKAIKQRRPTTLITIITVNNQTKQDGLTVNMEILEIRRGTIRFASSFSCTPDFFCVFSIRLLMHSKLSAAYAVRHYAQRGSGTYTDSPGSFREAGRLLSVGCSQPSGDSLHLESFLSLWGYKGWHTGSRFLNAGGRGRLDVVFRDEVR